MPRLNRELFVNPIWQSLQTHHRRFALSIGEACRYPADIGPFAAVAVPTRSAFRQLASLLDPGEALSVVADHLPPASDLRVLGTTKVLQMALPEDVVPWAQSSVDIARIGDTHAAEMSALAQRGMPDYFRKRTCELGAYYGIRAHDELVAMAGERLTIKNHVEISGVCTHPLHRKSGYASDLIWQIVRQHRLHGLGSWLHVGAANRTAISLYRRLGFRVFNTIVLQKLARI